MKTTKKTSKKSKTAYKPQRPLPATFAGADVVEGKGMLQKHFDALVEENALTEFITAPEGVYLVIPEDAVHDETYCQVKLFIDKTKAIRYAQALSNGNVDHRVLKVTDQTLVVGTESELPY
jgi:hypothetical protein